MTAPSLTALLVALRRKAERVEGAECERFLKIIAFVELVEDTAKTRRDPAFIEGVRQMVDAVGRLAEIDVPPEHAAKIDAALALPDTDEKES